MYEIHTELRSVCAYSIDYTFETTINQTSENLTVLKLL